MAENDRRESGVSSSVRFKFSRPLVRSAHNRLQVHPRRLAEGLAAGAAPRSRSRADILGIKADLQVRLLDELSLRGMLEADEKSLAGFVREFVAEVLEGEDLPLNESERDRLAGDLTEETLGVGPLAPLMADPAVTDILVNAPDQVYVERFGRMEEAEIRFRDGEHIMRVIERIAARVGRRIDIASPMVDLRLPDGSRVNATVPPASPDGPTISIRRFGRRRLRRQDLLRFGMISNDIFTFLDYAVRGKKSILISGGTGAGKSTLLGATCEAIPESERIVTIEDTMELLLDQRHVIRLETRPKNPDGQGEITTLDLLINTLRMRPDRIIVGEVRGPEAVVMLQAMNTGHEGGLSTIHANSPRDALSRLETMVLMAAANLTVEAIRHQIAAAIDLLVHVRRYEDGIRRVESIAEVTGLEGNMPLTQDLFRFVRRAQAGRQVIGDFEAAGVVPKFYDELKNQGLAMPLDLFQRPGAHSG